MAAGWLRRIAYSFVGLLACNALFSFQYFGFMLVGFWHAGLPIHIDEVLYGSGMLLFYFAFSIAGWILVGIPFVLAIPPRFLIRFHPAVPVLIGAILGPISLLLINAFLSRKFVFFEISKSVPLFVVAAIMGGFSTYVYSLLLLRFSNSSTRTEQKQVTS